MFILLSTDLLVSVFLLSRSLLPIILYYELVCIDLTEHKVVCSKLHFFVVW